MVKDKGEKIVAVQGMHNMRREGYTFHHLGYNLRGCVWDELLHEMMQCPKH